MKAVVKKIKRNKEYNAKFMDFANFYGFKVTTHRPYNPKAKGKVERMIPFVRNNILYGQEYSNMAELENTRVHWLTEANSRVHSELKEIPFERFEREKKYLNPLTRLYPIRYLRYLETRKVRKDGELIYQNERYELGNKYAGRIVNLERKGSIINIYLKDEKVKTELLKMNVETRSLKEYEEVSQIRYGLACL